MIPLSHLPHVTFCPFLSKRMSSLRLVPFYITILGYSVLSFILAFSMVNCQPTLFLLALHAAAHASTATRRRSPICYTTMELLSDHQTPFHKTGEIGNIANISKPLKSLIFTKIANSIQPLQTFRRYKRMKSSIFISSPRNAVSFSTEGV